MSYSTARDTAGLTLIGALSKTLPCTHCKLSSASTLVNSQYGLQARWVGFKLCWVTAGDDDTLRTWSTDGSQLQQFSYMGTVHSPGSHHAPGCNVMLLFMLHDGIMNVSCRC